MSDEARYRLAADDVFDKWGFDDGDVLDEVLDAWEIARGLSYDGDESGITTPYIDQHLFLFEAYRRFVGPHLERPVPVWLAPTLHNPVVAVEDTKVRNDLVVEVGREELFELADELFPPDRLVMLLHHHVYLSTKRRFSWPTYEQTRPVVERLLEIWDRRVLEIAVELCECRERDLPAALELAQQICGRGRIARTAPATTVA